MPKNVSSEMKDLVRRSIELGTKLATFLEGGVEPSLNPPASLQQVADFERATSIALPPSYRMFLSLHNGWKPIFASIHLLSIEEMTSGEYNQQILEWKERKSVRKRYPQVSSALIIGWSPESWKVDEADCLLLDLSKPDPQGEMPVTEFLGDEIELECRSFLHYLRLLPDRYEDLIQGLIE